MGAESAIFVRRGGCVNMELDGKILTSVSAIDHRILVERAAHVLGLVVVSPPAGSGINKLDRPPLFCVELGQFICILRSDGAVFEFSGPPDFMLAGMYNGAVAYSGYVAKLGANVLPFPKRRKQKKH